MKTVGSSRGITTATAAKQENRRTTAVMVLSFTAGRLSFTAIRLKGTCSGFLGRPGINPKKKEARPLNQQR